MNVMLLWGKPALGQRQSFGWERRRKTGELGGGTGQNLWRRKQRGKKGKE